MCPKHVANKCLNKTIKVVGTWSVITANTETQSLIRRSLQANFSYKLFELSNLCIDQFMESGVGISVTQP